MRIGVNGVRTYSKLSHCLDTELSPSHVFDSPVILRVWQSVCFSPAEELYSDKIVQIAKTALYTFFYLTDSVDTSSSSDIIDNIAQLHCKMFLVLIQNKYLNSC
ncbi:hypothetical protein AVEN_52823-1 [Araneus ventricosus]|uniref:Uncharacterized protein n=1 Tax=Araneus ventricosus TaxID=182803 RepID=A0A4Y2JE35_ARAVE|nr:hypothetical protein AVEN_52823-1 [Araneus ventricosus]